MRARVVTARPPGHHARRHPDGPTARRRRGRDAGAARRRAGPTRRPGHECRACSARAAQRPRRTPIRTSGRETGGEGGTRDDERAPPPLAVPRPRHRRKVFIAFGVSLGTTLITVASRSSSAPSSTTSSHQAPRALAAAHAEIVGLGAVNFVLAYFRRFAAAGSRSTCSTTCVPRCSGSCSDSTSRATTSSRPASSSAARRSDVALIQGFLQFLPIGVGNVLMFVVSLGRDAHPLAVARAA